MTLTEKVLARAAKRAVVTAGDNIWTSVDILLTHDVCGPGTIGVFKREFGANAKVWDREKIVITPDHYIFTSDAKCNRNVDILREFAAEQNLPYFYDVIDAKPGQRWVYDPEKANKVPQYGSRYAGVCHSAVAQKGHTRPGEVMIGTDSHTCSAGAFNMFSTGVGNTDAGFVMGTGKILLKVPPTIYWEFENTLSPGVMAKDIILYIIGELGVDGATYCALQFGGEGSHLLSMEERMTITNMAIEAGGKNGIFEFDSTTRDFVDERCRINGTKSQYTPVDRDSDEKFLKTFKLDLSQLEPTVACHPNPGVRKLARELRSEKLDRAYIGSCTGGKTSDFFAAAQILRGRQVSIPTFAVPATPEVERDMKTLQIEGKTLWQILEDSGALISANPGCAACLGGPQDTFGRMNQTGKCISTTNRNFPGRMGDKEAHIFLASPATVAASAVAGYVADPRDYLQ